MLPCQLSVKTSKIRFKGGFFGKMFWRYSEYLYEYKSTQGKWSRIVGNTAIRIVAATMWLVVLQSVRGGVEVLIVDPVCGSFILLIVFALLLFLPYLIYKPDLIPYLTVPLTVHISHGEVYLSKYVPYGSTSLRKRIFIALIKNAEVKLYTENGFSSLYSSVDAYDPEKGLKSLILRDPLRSIWTDGSSRQHGIMRCAVLELDGGQQFFIEFKGVDEFVAALNKLRGVTTEAGGA